MNRVGLLGLTAFLCFFTKVAAAQSAPFGDSRVQAPELAAPQRGSVAGQYAGVAFGPADVARGEFNLPSPFSAPEERGAILVSPFPTYAPDQGLSEWGLGWGVTLAIVRSRVTGDLDYRTDERTGPWGRMLRGSDGAWYPVGLRVAVRVKEAADDTLTAYLPDGSQWTFGMRVVNARGTYAWYPTAARDAVGHTASLTYDALPQGRPFLKRIEHGGFGPAHTAAVELT